MYKLAFSWLHNTALAKVTHSQFMQHPAMNNRKIALGSCVEPMHKSEKRYAVVRVLFVRGVDNSAPATVTPNDRVAHVPHLQLKSFKRASPQSLVSAALPEFQLL